jgi:hypothetical protein
MPLKYHAHIMLELAVPRKIQKIFNSTIKRINMKKLLTIAIIALLPVGVSHAIDNKQAGEKSRAVVKKFGGELKATLQAAMKEGGPINAIPVCNEKAPAIANDISEKEGILISRTSLKYRNPENKPDDWEKKVLEDFEKRKASGEDIKTMEYSEVITHKTGQKIYRYMKPIPTADVCLMCHGEAISEPVVKTLDELYPDDKARGFKKGDIRGAFSVIQTNY